MVRPFVLTSHSPFLLCSVPVQQFLSQQLLEGVTAYDSHDGDVTASLLIEKVTETGNGKVIVTYAAVDSSNNVAEQSRILKVEK